jgi:uncharacterized protein YkuJ
MKSVALFCLSILLLKANTVLSQTLTLSGKVIDKANKKPLGGVSIQIDRYNGTLTNGDGHFQLHADAQTLRQFGLNFSYVGYSKMHLSYKGDSVFLVEMETVNHELTEVVIYGKGLTIMEKAIARIPLNYPQQPTGLNGIMRVYNTIEDSAYFYKSDAVVRVYMPPYTKQGGHMEIKVVQNREVLLTNRRSDYFNDPLKVKWVGGFHSVPDPVLERPGYLKREDLGDYDFQVTGKSIWEGRRVFVIDFQDKAKKSMEGTLYIDTATYAFVSIDVTAYKIFELLFAPTSIRKEHAAYRLVAGKWYLNTAHSDSKHDIAYNNNYWVDFAATSLDTVAVSPFDYQDVAQRMDENIKTLKPGNTQDWPGYDSLFKKAEASGSIAVFPTPSIDPAAASIPSRNRVVKGIFGYLTGDNVRVRIGVGVLPFRLTGRNTSLTYQSPNSGLSIQDSKTLASFSNASIQEITEFRLYKNLFVGLQGNSNYGIGGLTAKESGYYLIDYVNVNRRHRPISLSPLVGYTQLNFSKTFGKYYSDSAVVNGHRFSNQNVQVSLESHTRLWTAGLNCSIEWTRRRHIFISGAWYSNSFNQWDDLRFKATKGSFFYKKSETTDSNGEPDQLLPVRPSHWALSAGLLLTLL